MVEVDDECDIQQLVLVEIDQRYENRDEVEVDIERLVIDDVFAV